MIDQAPKNYGNLGHKLSGEAGDNGAHMCSWLRGHCNLSVVVMLVKVEWSFFIRFQRTISKEKIRYYKTNIAVFLVKSNSD